MGYARMRAVADEIAARAPDDVWATEISGSEIIVLTGRANLHELIVHRLARRLDRQLEQSTPGLIAHGGADVEDPESGIKRHPDVMVFPERVLESGEAVHPRDVTAVVEVVSKSNRRTTTRARCATTPPWASPTT
ncbi:MULTISPECIES: Uma2 family endonuclease [unclassified Kitasatospora]|uniref:Uma2 family endonuclease n=1 Tax=unclassified Kitasatospora TaxID=2633591 RepID=UPI000710BE47|nr:hypothetical protein ASC99_24090 [Kitasatospora sp. Root107]KRB77512.1 hypothetical protein ASE03_00290 [Kitasatospora sp. Root187]